MCNKKYLGTLILCFLNTSRDITLSIAKLDEKIPECVYGIFRDSNILWTNPSSPYLPWSALKTNFGFNFLNLSAKYPFASNSFTLYPFF